MSVQLRPSLGCEIRDGNKEALLSEILILLV